MKHIALIIALFLPFAPYALSGAEPAETRPASSDLKSDKIESLMLKKASLYEIGRLLGNALNRSISVSKDAGAVPVTAYLKNIAPRDALNAICTANGLWFKEDPVTGIIHIQTVEEFKNSVQLGGRDTVEIVPIMYPSATDLGDALSLLYDTKVIWNPPDNYRTNELESLSSAIERMDLLGRYSTTDASLNSSSGSSSSNLNGSRYGGSYGSSYGSSGSSYGSGGSYTNSRSAGNRYGNNRDLRRNSNGNTNDMSASDMLETQINTIFQNLRPAAMVKLGQEINDRTDIALSDITNNPGMVYMTVMPDRNALMLRSADPQAIEQIKQMALELDKPSPQVMLEIKLLNLDLTDDHNRSVDFLFGGDGAISGGFDNGTIAVGGNSAQSGQNIGGINPGTLIPQGAGLDPRMAILQAVGKNFKARIQMLRTESRLTTLASPNLLVKDKEASNLFIGDERSILISAESTTTYTTDPSGGQTPNISWTTEVERRKIGTMLLITPTIHADRSVTLRVLQEQSSADGEKDTIIFGDQKFESTPVKSQMLNSTVIAQDQSLVVIGGLISEQVGKKTEKVPGLCEIPIIGEYLFTRLAEERKKTELVILIRPFVLIAPGEEDAMSRTYIERMSQHPSAKGDIPSLGAFKNEEIAKPHSVNPEDPLLKRVLERIRDWQIDDETAVDVEDAARAYQKAKRQESILNEIDAIKAQTPESAPQDAAAPQPVKPKSEIIYSEPR